MLTKEDLKEKIKTKFGTLSNFARAAKIDRYELQKTFARANIPQTEMQVLEGKCDALSGEQTGNVISADMLAKLKAAIDNVGGPYQFCKDNPEFNVRQVYDVYNGQRTRKSGLVEKLFRHFEIQ